MRDINLRLYFLWRPHIFEPRSQSHSQEATGLPDDIERWRRQRENLSALLRDLDASASDYARRKSDLEEWIASLDQHIAELEKRRT